MESHNSDLWREKKEQSNRKEVEMASLPKTSNVILSSGLATPVSSGWLTLLW